MAIAISIWWNISLLFSFQIFEKCKDTDTDTDKNEFSVLLLTALIIPYPFSVILLNQLLSNDISSPYVNSGLYIILESVWNLYQMK
jgi:hypothetical protein